MVGAHGNAIIAVCDVGCQCSLRLNMATWRVEVDYVSPAVTTINKTDSPLFLGQVISMCSTEK